MFVSADKRCFANGGSSKTADVENWRRRWIWAVPPLDPGAAAPYTLDMPNLLVNVDVDDLERGVRFYTEALALKVGRRFPSAVELLGAGAPIWLLLNAAETSPCAGASIRRSYQRHWTPVHLDFAVESLEAAVQRAEHAGAVVERAISEHVWGRMALASDPFGHGFCLLEFKGRGYDEITTDMD